MKLIFCVIITFFFVDSFAQQKSSTISVSHYPNSELYLKADVICRITDKSGKPAVNGKYLSIENKSVNSFKYSYPTAIKSERTVSPGKKTLIPIERNSDFSFIPLKVTYTPIVHSKPYQKIQELRKIHSQSDQLVFKNGPIKPVKPQIPSKVASVKAAPKSEQPLPKMVKTAPKMPVKTSQNQEIMRETGPDILACIHTAHPAYYTFYYLKVNNEVIYSNVFAVPEYTMEEEGQELLEQAWMCFVPALRAHYSEQQIDKMLNDRDNDLQLGMLHLRDPFIPSATIASNYPYTRSFESAQAELENWKTIEKKDYPELRFVKVVF